MNNRRFLSASLAFFAGALALAQENFVPFVIPEAVPENSLIARRNEPIAIDAPRIVVKDGHFFRGAERYRAWGVNLCFNGNFPTHAEADSLARRLEAFGINSARIHHQDGQKFPNGIWDPEDLKKISTEALDRLDYLIAALANRGITTNFNLHVSRTWSTVLGLPDSTVVGNYNKIVDLFTPQLIDAQKSYAREILCHLNPYRKVAYSADPAVAFVEINNEDSFFMWNAEQKMPLMPAFYADILKGKWNAWLQQRYPNRADLVAKWQPGRQSPPVPPLKLAQTGDAASQWVLERSQGAKATCTPLDGSDGVRITVEKLGDAGWNLQYHRPRLTVSAETRYTARFRARADKERPLSVRLQTAADYKNLADPRDIKLTAEWKDHSLTFTATADSANARLSFLYGTAATALEISDLVLESRGLEGLAAAEDPAQNSVALHSEAETTARRYNRMRFLAETEKAYWDGMLSFIRKDLGCQAIVTGTIVFGPLGLYTQSDMDFIDTHSYWQHPRFPSRPWSPTDWTVEPRSMVENPDLCRIGDLAASRLAGKPFTVTEYNHSAPNDYQAECIPMIAITAAAQDWDGIWIFDYTAKSGAGGAGFYGGYFSIENNPAKLAFMPAGAAIFRDAAFSPLQPQASFPLGSSADILAALALKQERHGLSMLPAITPPHTNSPSFITQQFRITLGEPSLPSPASEVSSPQSPIAWSPGRFEARGQRSWVVIETPKAPKPYRLRDGFTVLTATSMDAEPLEKSRKVLLTIGARCENTDMKFSTDRRTVGRNWGKAPVQIEKLAVNLTWFSSTPVTLTPLNPDGTPAAAVTVQPGADGTVVLPLGSSHQTMWYILTR